MYICLYVYLYVPLPMYMRSEARRAPKGNGKILFLLHCMYVRYCILLYSTYDINYISSYLNKHFFMCLGRYLLTLP